ncbi:uncharacterized protein LOC108680934 [Hyalella azteca]|uniref:Uncharacterized protein LOC108680934 n=1 Tax=Hyalella azteca TaxID=294128 RepID=A0A8B7PGT0_HYAAZ|nr:uncharacterized protein LOC108680934 [Hyalella azteca]
MRGKRPDQSNTNSQRSCFRLQNPCELPSNSDGLDPTSAWHNSRSGGRDLSLHNSNFFENRKSFRAPCGDLPNFNNFGTNDLHQFSMKCPRKIIDNFCGQLPKDLCPQRYSTERNINNEAYFCSFNPKYQSTRSRRCSGFRSRFNGGRFTLKSKPARLETIPEVCTKFPASAYLRSCVQLVPEPLTATNRNEFPFRKKNNTMMKKFAAKSSPLKSARDRSSSEPNHVEYQKVIIISRDTHKYGEAQSSQDVSGTNTDSDQSKENGQQRLASAKPSKISGIAPLQSALLGTEYHAKIMSARETRGLDSASEKLSPVLLKKRTESAHSSALNNNRNHDDASNFDDKPIIRVSGKKRPTSSSEPSSICVKQARGACQVGLVENTSGQTTSKGELVQDLDGSERPRDGDAAPLSKSTRNENGSGKFQGGPRVQFPDWCLGNSQNVDEPFRFLDGVDVEWDENGNIVLKKKNNFNCEVVTSEQDDSDVLNQDEQDSENEFAKLTTVRNAQNSHLGTVKLTTVPKTSATEEKSSMKAREKSTCLQEVLLATSNEETDSIIADLVDEVTPVVSHFKLQNHVTQSNTEKIVPKAPDCHSNHKPKITKQKPSRSSLRKKRGGNRQHSSRVSSNEINVSLRKEKSFDLEMPSGTASKNELLTDNGFFSSLRCKNKPQELSRLDSEIKFGMTESSVFDGICDRPISLPNSSDCLDVDEVKWNEGTLFGDCEYRDCRYNRSALGHKWIRGMPDRNFSNSSPRLLPFTDDPFNRANVLDFYNPSKKNAAKHRCSDQAAKSGSRNSFRGQVDKQHQRKLDLIQPSFSPLERLHSPSAFHRYRRSEFGKNSHLFHDHKPRSVDSFATNFNTKYSSVPEAPFESGDVRMIDQLRNEEQEYNCSRGRDNSQKIYWPRFRQHSADGGDASTLLGARRTLPVLHRFINYPTCDKKEIGQHLPMTTHLQSSLPASMLRGKLNAPDEAFFGNSFTRSLQYIGSKLSPIDCIPLLETRPNAHCGIQLFKCQSREDHI